MKYRHSANLFEGHLRELEHQHPCVLNDRSPFSPCLPLVPPGELPFDRETENIADTPTDSRRPLGDVRRRLELAPRSAEFFRQLESNLAALQHEPHGQAKLGRFNAWSYPGQPAILSG